MKSKANNTIILEIEVRESELQVFERSERTKFVNEYVCTLKTDEFPYYLAKQTIGKILDRLYDEVMLWNYSDDDEDEKQ